MRLLQRVARAAVAACLVLGFASCERSPKAPEASPPPPEHLMAVAHIRSVDDVVTQGRGFIDAAIPGAGQAAVAEIEGALGQLRGLDRARPIAIMIVARPQDQLRVAATLPIADVKRFDESTKGQSTKRRGKLAVVGDPIAVEAVGAWALQALPANGALPPKSLVHVAVHSRVAATKLREVLAQATGELRQAAAADASLRSKLDVFVDVFAAVGDIVGQSARAEAVVSLADGALDVTFSLSPLPKTALATFTEAQATSDFLIMRRVPLEGVGMVGGGRLALGPAAPAVWSLVERLAAGTAFAPLVPELRVLFEHSTGEAAFAGNFSPDAFELAALYRVTDVGKAKAGVAAIAEKLRKGGAIEVDLSSVKVRYEALPDEPPRDGVVLHRLQATYDYSGSQLADAALADLPKRHEVAMGAWDDVIGIGGGAYRDAIVARSRKPGDFSAEVSALVDAASARKASFVEIVDYSAIFAGISRMPAGPPAPLIMWIGFADKRVELGYRVTSSAIANGYRAIFGAMGAMGANPPATP